MGRQASGPHRLILEIFADRARTREGVLQVELAALSYQRTRLVRAWTHLERQRGGFGFVGGPAKPRSKATAAPSTIR
jgi:GTP-binding protein HflX